MRREESRFRGRGDKITILSRAIANKLLSTFSTGYWKEGRSLSKNNTVLAYLVGAIIEEYEIAQMWRNKSIFKFIDMEWVIASCPVDLRLKRSCLAHSSNKYKGEDSIPPEVITYASHSLHGIFYFPVSVSSTFSGESGTSSRSRIIRLLDSLSSNCRPISITSAASGLLGIILKNRKLTHLQTTDSQFGFIWMKGIYV